MIVRIILIAFFVWKFGDIQSQNNCADYIQVCGNQSISLNVSGGGIQEIGFNTWCFYQEHNSLWLRFTILTGGTLGFNLIPASTNIIEDYDFMIFGPNVTCNSKGSPIRCSSTNPQAAGSANNHTGMRSSSSDVSEGPGNLGDNWIQWLTVSAGKSYFLLIDRPLGNSSFTLNWTGSAVLKKTNAGPDLNACKGKTATMAATETGTWVQHSTNPATVTFSSLTNPNATVSGLNTVGIYRFTWSSLGCADTMQITVNNTSASNQNKSICQGQSFNGHNTAGVYIDTFQNKAGCDSIVTLNLTVLNNSASTIAKTICQGESFLGRSTSGTYVDKLVSVNGCDSIRTLNLVVNPSHSPVLNKSICDGESFMGRTATGTYTFNYKNSFGCDSILTLNLKVNDYSNVVINAAICEGQSYNGKTIDGTYRDSFKSIEGCDSIRTLNLTVNKHSVSTVYDTICQGQTSGGHSTTGTFVDVLRNAKNCDSTRTLHLVVKPNSFFTVNRKICEGQSFLGRSVSGSYSDIFVSANGCDSTRTLFLWVSKKQTISISKSICEGETFMGRNQTGFYIDTLRNDIGCDSIITFLNLNVISKDSFLQKTICEGENFLGYDSTGVYFDNIVDENGCPRLRRLDLTVNPITYGSEIKIICFGESYKGKGRTGKYSIKYKNVNGCDSFYSLDLTVKPDFLIKTLRDTNTCTGNPIVLKVKGGYKAYAWSDGEMDSIRSVFNSGKYTVTVTNNDDCLSTDDSKVYFYPIPEVEIGEDTVIYDGEVLRFEPRISGRLNYNSLRWTPKGLFKCDSCLNQFLETPVNTYVKFAYRDDNTCYNSDSIYISVLPVQNVGFPTAFSPNGDGVNDFFELNGGPVRTLTLSIYNRWGEKVYDYTGKIPSWDGKFKGEPAPSGVYTYFVRFNLYKGGIQEKMGTLTIIR
jgi:gliding motility-associated-like protein